MKNLKILYLITDLGKGGADSRSHGVGRFLKDLVKDVPIIKGFAENSPLS